MNKELNEKITSMFPYEFDQFQEKSCKDIENDKHVLSLASTSAGKSTIAYYAILLCFLNNTRLVYTAPVKSLSNEKFNDLVTKFAGKYVGNELMSESDFGLLTGDEKRNTNARILIMTTEIFRNLLFRMNETSVISETNQINQTKENIKYEIDSALLFNNLQFVVFDEGHYLNDKSRGNVYEESSWQILQNLEKVQMIYLSATFSNPEVLVNWVNKISKNRTMEISSTTYRPVPLEYYVFVPCPETFSIQANLPWNDLQREGSLIHFFSTSTKLMEQGNYERAVLKHNEHFNHLRIYEKDNYENQHIDKWERKFKVKKRQKEYDNFNLLNYFCDFLGINSKLPAIFFVLSRRKCNVLAEKVTNSYLTHEERSKSENLFNKYIQRLNYHEQYEQVIFLKKLLMKGIAIHHSELLVVLKEIVELLFREGLIKIMFATETLAIGVNTQQKLFVSLN